MFVDFGWDDGTIGEFQRLSEWAQANRRLARELADSNGPLLMRAVAAGGLQLRDMASMYAPYDTGTLASAHRVTVEPYQNGAQAVINIDEAARNPVYGGRPAIYGEVWAERYFNWFERVAEMQGDAVLDQVEQAILVRIDDLWL